MPEALPVSTQGGRRLETDESSPSPLVSIIIVVFRARAELENLLRDIAALHLSDYEVVVIDGGSKDGSVEFLQSAEDLVDIWISEPDAGIYDAMNKGIRAARGEYVIHINAGDRLLQLPLATLRRCLADQIDVATFRVSLDGKRLFQPRSGLRAKIFNPWHHQGTFYRRTSHLFYDTSYLVFGDLELNHRMIVAGARIRLLDEVVANHESGGVSSITSGTPAIREVWRSVRTHFGVLYVPIAYLWFHLYFVLRAWRNRAIR